MKDSNFAFCEQVGIYTPGQPPQGPGQKEKEYMGDSFGLVDIALPEWGLDARPSGSLQSSSQAIQRNSLLAMGLLVAVVMLSGAPGVAAQGYSQANESAKGTESDVKFIQAPGPAQAAAPLTITLQDAMERARKLDPTRLRRRCFRCKECAGRPHSSTQCHASNAQRHFTISKYTG